MRCCVFVVFIAFVVFVVFVAKSKSINEGTSKLSHYPTLAALHNDLERPMEAKQFAKFSDAIAIVLG